MSDGRPLMEVGFPGGMAVEARFKGHVVRTDQPASAGGEDSGPAPFDLFLASIATCMGFYALSFCRRRGLDTEGLLVTLEPRRDPEAGRVARLDVAVRLPSGFPDKYRRAILLAMEKCTVKRHLSEPPEVRLEVAEP